MRDMLSVSASITVEVASLTIGACRAQCSECVDVEAIKVLKAHAGVARLGPARPSSAARHGSHTTPPTGDSITSGAARMMAQRWLQSHKSAASNCLSHICCAVKYPSGATAGQLLAVQRMAQHAPTHARSSAQLGPAPSRAPRACFPIPAEWVCCGVYAQHPFAALVQHVGGHTCAPDQQQA